jgi:hypothetical protein
MDSNDITENLHKSQCWDVFQECLSNGCTLGYAACKAEELYKNLQLEQLELNKNRNLFPESVSHWGLVQ